MGTPAETDPAIAKRTMKKVLWRLIPFLMLLYIINILDRGNLGYIALDMNEELGITAIAYGSLAAAFYIGYLVFEVPSNVLLEKFGARSVISRIMVTWGIAVVLMFFAQEYWQLYALRVILGIMEAGFFPGVIFYLSKWVPPAMRGRAVTYFFVGSQVGTMISPVVATWIMENITWLGHSGWRWVFMIEGIPAVICGIVAWFYLTNKPADATWLSAEEKDWLENELNAEKAVNKPRDAGFLNAFRSLRVWHLAFIYLLFQAATQGISFWMPLMVKGFSESFSNMTVGWIMAAPSAIAIVFMIFWGRNSDRTGERKYHAMVPLFIAVAGIVIAATADNVYMQITGVIVYGAAYPAFYGVFWTLPTIHLTGAEAAVGIAIINTASSASTWAGSTGMGYVDESFGSVGVLTLAGTCLAASVFLLWLLRAKDQLLRKEVGRDPVITAQD